MWSLAAVPCQCGQSSCTRDHQQDFVGEAAKDQNRLCLQTNAMFITRRCNARVDVQARGPQLAPWETRRTNFISRDMHTGSTQSLGINNNDFEN